jgi:hypothetical protein
MKLNLPDPGIRVFPPKEFFLESGGVGTLRFGPGKNIPKKFKMFTNM